jgi:hypothetical protein
MTLRRGDGLAPRANTLDRPEARFAFDVFNPNVRLLADADGIPRTRESLAFADPDRGAVSVDVAETYDSAAQVTRGTWHFSTETEHDFLVVPLEIRSIFPRNWPRSSRAARDSGASSRGTDPAPLAPLQLYVCELA